MALVTKIKEYREQAGYKQDVYKRQSFQKQICMIQI